MCIRDRSLSIKFQFIGGMKVGEPSADGRGSAHPELAEQQARAGSEAAVSYTHLDVYKRQVKQLRQPLPFRGAKHFHTAAPMGWRREKMCIRDRCESAFALLSHQKVTKRL